MAPIKPVLVVFGISHFCEKARWALDWHGISYTEIGWPPGLHRALLKQHGAKGSSLPVVLDGDLVVEGSGAIIDWAESKAQDRTRSLNPQTGDLAETREIERRADEVVGFHVRRLAYAETLPYYSHLVRPTLFLRCTAWHRLIGGVMWPVTRRIMMQMYDIRPGAASESRTAFFVPHASRLRVQVPPALPPCHSTQTNLRISNATNTPAAANRPISKSRSGRHIRRTSATTG